MTVNAISSRLALAAFSRACLTSILTCLLLALGLSSARAEGSGCGVTARAGFQDLTFQSGGMERTAVVFIPPNYTAKTKVPVVFDLHGSNSFPRDQMGRSQWPDVAKENGFIVVAPQGGLSGKLEGTHAWNVPGVTNVDGPDDATYLSDTIALVKAKFCVDSSRIYASGYSGGGRMLSQYICNGNADFSAAGFVMSLRAGYPRQEAGKWLPDPQSCHPAKPVSIIAFWGLKDNTNPYVGGGKPYWQYGGETALNRWAELDGCEKDTRLTKGTAVSSMEFSRCKGGARILSYTIADQTHDWPSTNVGFSLVSANAKEPQQQVFAAKRMWAFFEQRDGNLVANAVARSNDCATAPKAKDGSAIAATTAACEASTAKAKPQPAKAEESISARAL
ncbi:alpha/beta hydrolase family esterase [Rhizobium paknamense]|uniref:Polyhydroxybutyrate depolymerase n=1 Tax=Rhizobium paknamense TaxID=1206817 RepID=A0ABU0IHP5_9HYPH|nr:PHB depolymerase family esterase [Rhizobium paknamense]MDQ0457148.1 polyhydroxybutyrate depolymerase [Rhizobium paknamense]